MERKYQVFISSTFLDLEEERREIMEVLINKGHIPIGMELFNAADEIQWNVIKRKIDECDLYVLILSDRYGSTDDNGIGFTEKEYDYAISQGKTVHSYLRTEKSIENLKFDYRETENKIILKEFKKKISKKIYKPWNDKNDLSKKFLFAFDDFCKEAPNTAGWIKIDKIGSDWDDKLKDANLLRKLGVEKINYDGIRDQEKIRRQIENAKEEIKMIFTTGMDFIMHENSSQLIKAMENGCRVNVLVATIESEYVNDLHKIQRHNKYYTRGWHDLNIELANLSSFLRSNKPANAKIKLGHYNTQFRANMLIIDGKYGFYTPTLPPKSSRLGISLELVTGKVLTDCLNHFDSIMDEVDKEGKIEKI